MRTSVRSAPSSTPTSRSPSEADRLSQSKLGTRTYLKVHRLALGLSLRDVANLVTPPMSTATLRGVENQEHRPSAATIDRLATYYGVSPATIERWAATIVSPEGTPDAPKREPGHERGE